MSHAPSPLAKGLFHRAIGESGGLFEPLQLAPKYLLANAERDGEKYVASLGATSLSELRRLPADRLTQTAASSTRNRTLPASRFALQAFASGQQDDIAAPRFERRRAPALTDVTHVKAATFDSDLEHSFGQLPPSLTAAYPHATDEEHGRRGSTSSATSSFAWDMWAWAWARLQAGTGKSPVYYYSFRQKPPRLCVRRLGREPLRRALVCLRPSKSGALALEQRRSESGRGDVHLLGPKFAKSGNPNGHESTVAGVRQRG